MNEYAKKHLSWETQLKKVISKVDAKELR